MNNDLMDTAPELNPKPEQTPGTETSGPRIYFDELLAHVEKHDLSRLYEGAQFKAMLEQANALFGPWASRLEQPSGWIAANWASGSERYGYKLADSGKARTAARCPRMLESLSITPTNAAPFLWLFSGTSGHWNIGRGGKGIKAILGADANWKNADWPAHQQQMNAALACLAGFEPSKQSGQEFWEKTLGDQKWPVYPDLSVLFHLVWPQFFPVHYKKTEWGYSQLQGIDRLLNEISLKLGLKRKPLDLNQYADYAAAYRLLLVLFDVFVEQDSARSTPHFDFLSMLLAERADVEAEELMLMKRAMVIYGIPGTGKTYFAQGELLVEPLFDSSRVHRTQFHAGFSYADFMIGIRPQTSGGEISYEVEPGMLYRLAAEAANALKQAEKGAFGDGRPVWQDTEGEEPSRVDLRNPLRYALLIDEINRADLARVLGEVSYCIEYRGESNTIALPHRMTTEVTSVFSGQPIDDPFAGGTRFYLPENLYIIGTMNQADRSIGAFDAALRRRFAWHKLDFSVGRLQQMLEVRGLKQLGQGKALPKGLVNSIPAFLDRANRLNALIAKGRSNEGSDERHVLPLGAEHRVGHTWFGEIISIMESTGSLDGRITPLHLERLWLYYLHPQLEDALGFEAANYIDQLNQLRDVFTQAL